MNENNNSSSNEQQQQMKLTTNSIPQHIADKFLNYVCSVCGLLIEANEQELYIALSETFHEQITTFLTKSKVPVLFIQKVNITSSTSNNSGLSSVDSNQPLSSDQQQQPSLHLKDESQIQQQQQQYSYSCDISMEFKEQANGVAFAKRDPKTFTDKMLTTSFRTFSPLLQTVEITNSVNNPFEFLHNYLKTTFEPYFTSLGKKKVNEKVGIESVTSGIKDLKLALEQAQNSFQLPEINVLSYIHPKIKEIVAENTNDIDLSERIEELKQDSKVLQDIGKRLQECSQEIRKLIDPPNEETPFHSVIQEINYWVGMEKLLQKIDEQSRMTQVSYTIKVLKESNRNISVTPWITLPINTALENAKNCASLLRDLPINDIQNAKDVGDVILAVEDMFKQLSKIKNYQSSPTSSLSKTSLTSISNSYPARGARLVAAISQTVRDKLQNLLKNSQILYVSFEQFEFIVRQSLELFTALELGVKNFEKIAMVIAKRTNTQLPSFTDKLEHTNLKRRLEDIRNFRTSHEQLEVVIHKALPQRDTNDDMNVHEEVAKAFEAVRSLNNKVLDTSSNGVQQWKNAMRIYNEKIDLVEAHIATQLKEKLGAAKSASEMFRVFSKFNSLFYMPKIKGAITQHQDRLIEKVKEDIHMLEQKFKKHYASSEAEKMSHLRDLPSVSGAIIWARQIEKQLEVYMKRVESVFGNGWDRLKDMRQFNHYWLLNDKLADFMGIPFYKLEHKVANHPLLKSEMKSEIKGTAIALAFLELVYAESEEQWKVMFQESMEALQKELKRSNIVTNVYAAALDMLREEQNIGARHTEETKLRQKAEKFKKKLGQNIDDLLDKWNKDVVDKIAKWKIFDVSKGEVAVRGFIFEVTKDKLDRLDLRVNFHRDIGILIKEVRNLTSLEMDKRIMQDIKYILIEACNIYPLAVSLIESVKTYNRVLTSMDSFIQPLAAEEIRQVQSKISEGFNWPWKSANLELYCKELYERVSRFQNIVSSLLLINTKIRNNLELIKVCAPKRKTLQEYLSNIQAAVDEIALEEAYSNLKFWVQDLNKEIEQILIVRLQELITLWMNEYKQLSNKRRSDSSSGGAVDEDEEQRLVQQEEDNRSNSLFTQLAAAPFRIEIQVNNRKMRAVPPLARSRAFWISRFSILISWICDLPVIRSDTYASALSNNSSNMKYQNMLSFRYLLTRLPRELLQEVYKLVEVSITTADEYIRKWLQYQALWDIDTSALYNQLGSDIAAWLDLVEDVVKSQSIITTHQREKDLGSIIVGYNDVYEKVTAKYDNTLKEILVKFRNELEVAMKDLFKILSRERLKVENTHIEANNRDAIKFLSMLQSIKKNHKAWEDSITQFRRGEQRLLKHHMKLPSGWIYAANIEGEWTAFNEIVKRRNDAMKSLKDQIIKNLLLDDTKLDKDIAQFVEKFKKEKPLDGNMTPVDALRSLSGFESKIKALQDDVLRICEAREALDLEPGDNTRLDPYLEELASLKSVWQSMQDIWDELNELSETAFNSVMWRKVKRQLEALLEKIRKLSSWMLSYAAVEHLQSVIRLHISELNIIKDLREESMKDRHWQELKKLLNKSNWVLTELTLGQIWECKIIDNESVFKEVLRKAQGEVGLENFLKKVRDFWQDYQFDVVNYNNKCTLIKGWDDLFKQVSDDLEGLSAMKASQFFKTFEDEAMALDTKINKVRMTCDVWIDVQRIWVYLEGVFTGNADIRYQLPREAQKFQTINNDFKQLMRKVQQNPRVLEVINIANIIQTLEKLNQSLIKIQKSLGEYLEKQRAAFPRFYFVGDEDLLEIIGNSDDPTKIQKHLRKMFAGISSLIMDQNNTVVNGIASREGEIVMLKKPVVIEQNQSINVWLTNVEKGVQESLAYIVKDAITDLTSVYDREPSIDESAFVSWVTKYPAQLVVLASQVVWTSAVEKSLRSGTPSLSQVKSKVKGILDILAGGVLLDHHAGERKKFEHLITELVHQRDVITALEKDNISSPKDFSWLYNMRFYWDEKKSEITERLVIEIANATFTYGFEYLGVIEKLVQTPLTDRCYLALTQALHSRLGGSPFGPAGTGKTETVKALGAQLGRFVLVFNCDENFDFKAMGRIFVGLCQCGAWGCFDEFNRLEEKILSAVSQQIQKIQLALRDRKYNIDIVDRNIIVKENTGIFITMNPGYAGRSNLPDNLKQLFRNIAMVKPDKELIAQVILYSQGFKQAEILARKIVLFFNLCLSELSNQSHYDFGLRGLKSVLINAGNIRRLKVETTTVESNIIIQSVEESMIPKLVGEDVTLLRNLLSDLFPGCTPDYAPLTELRQHIESLCNEYQYVYDETWVEKLIQLYKIQNLQHGVMLVGPSGCGKSSCLKVLLQALEKLDGVKGNQYTIDPKSLSKDELYGFLDPTTREWTDGIFTHVLRKIIDNVRGEINQRHWIVFDGDVDPEWVENLNSVLDDNKLFTLPNGERLALPTNVKIMFEVQDLRSATLATVSRCGMIWFSQEVISPDMTVYHFLQRMKNISLDDEERAAMLAGNKKETKLLALQRHAVKLWTSYFEENGFVFQCMEQSAKSPHIMDFCRLGALNSLFALLNKSILRVHEYNMAHTDFPLDTTTLDNYLTKRLVYATLWGFGSSMSMATRTEFAEYVSSISSSQVPDDGSLLDYEVNVEDGQWSGWASKVPEVNIETHKVISSDSVIPTLDTIRHEDLLGSWIVDHRSVILCGPPGSGKTMILTSVLRSLPSYDACFLNFSSATQPDLVLKTFEQYCEVVNTAEGLVLQPNQTGKWLVVFCDEINLPANDKYGTQRVITFMRQLIEQGGYWRASDLSWIKLRRIMFVGACNPPTDAGRVPMTERFLRHCPMLFVDFPAPSSLRQIYGTFNRALLKLVPDLAGYSEPTTRAMVDFWSASQKYFTPDNQPHYVYSPRELSRWIRAMYEALRPLDTLDLEEYVRLLVHEGLRIFSDRLVLSSEKKWTDEKIDQIVLEHFPNIDSNCLARPILFSNWLNKNYVSIEADDLRHHISERLKTFAEEELEVKLVLFDSVLEHVLRIDRVLKQPLGHLLLVGVSGVGKTILSKFAAWMNGYGIFQIKAHRNYLLKDFEDDLRKVLRRAGCKGERLVFIFDESNVLKPSFLEYMNSLLASGEVPGLFEGEELSTLMSQCRDAVNTLGLVGIDSDDELYHWFVTQVQRNLHIVFTINPANADFKSRSATSPALFNRCVIDWFGDWSQEAMYQVGEAFTRDIHLECVENPDDAHRGLVSSLVNFHNIVIDASRRVEKASGKRNFITPRHYLDFINHFRDLYTEKRHDLQEQQLHINLGLKNLTETEADVSKLQLELKEKEKILETKKKLAKEKLDIMVENQKDAEKKKQEAEVLSIQLDQESAIIEKKKQVSENELAEVIPKLERAKSQIRDVPRSTWTTLRNYAQPPQQVQKTLELVILIIYNVDSDKWQDVKTYVSKADFTQRIISFKPEDVSVKIRTKVNQKLSALDPDAIFNASSVCFTMFEWMKAMIQFSQISQAAEPLRKEVADLSEKCDKLKEKHSELLMTIKALEDKIKVYEEEYKALFQETNMIEMEMQSVNAKVDRSQSLLKSLSSETVRWREQSGGFEKQIATLVGDVLLSSGLLTYGGFFDELYRNQLHHKWITILENAVLKFKNDLSLIEYLSTPDERLEWESNKLPTDNICVQNAIIIKRFKRYPLIIDPTGQATDYILNQYKSANIAKTSFSDSSFMKILESSLRFGTPVLVQDAESVDPILNPILNKEIRRIGGRNLVTLGNQDIDLSPSFNLILVTRDPTHQFEPDLSSRVTFVNFTVTPSSLHSQCLSTILQAERPEIDKQRSEQLKLQGEYQVKLRNLEQSLLDALSEAKGNILENATLVATLEKLKKNAVEIADKVKESDAVMEQMTVVSETYSPLAGFCSSIYFTLAQLADLHFLYHFSLSFFFDILHHVLSMKKTQNEEERIRVEKLCYNLFSTVYKRVSRSLLHEDKLAFALRLADIRQGFALDGISVGEKEFLLKKGYLALSTVDTESEEIALSNSQEQMVQMLDYTETFKDIRKSLNSDALVWKEYLLDEHDVTSFPEFWRSSSNKAREVFRKLMIVKALKPEALLSTFPSFVSAVFDDNFLKVPELNLQEIVENESNCFTPLLLCSMPGYDAGQLIDSVALSTKRTYTPIAMGTTEAYEQANKTISTAVRKGTWVVLKNVHLAPSYLVQLEKNIHSMRTDKQVNQNFRLFLTSEIHPNIPVNLLRRSYILLFEPPDGIKAHLSQTFVNLSPTVVDKVPVERSRLYLLVAWFHSVVQERLRYQPLGWTKRYEFNQSDLKWAFDTLDKWVDITAQDRSNIQPSQLPWKAIHVLLGQSIYGGKVDNEFDQMVLKSFLEQLFTPSSYSPDFTFFSSKSDKGLLGGLEGTKYVHFTKWIESLPSNQTPEWLGLPNNVSKLTKIQQAEATLLKFLKIQNVTDDSSFEDERTDADNDSSSSSQGSTPLWVTLLKPSVVSWLEELPTEFKKDINPNKIANPASNPLYRCFRREFSVAHNLLALVRSDLNELLDVCDSKIKVTNHHRDLIEKLNKGMIPSSWKHFTHVETITVNMWITDLTRRIQQFKQVQETIEQQGHFNKSGVWLGGLLFPEAYLTATRQYVSHKYKVPLEALTLQLRVGLSGSALEDYMNNDTSFVITGLQIECADVSEDKIVPSERLTTHLPPVVFTWVDENTVDVVDQESEIKLPLYLNASRTNLLTTLTVKKDINVHSLKYYQRGTSLSAWA